MTTIHDTIIRSDPLGTGSANGRYGIPADNPFAMTDGPELPEIWSYGHRNHHRMAWDTHGDQALYSFEMGQAMIEEVNLSPIPADEVPGTFQYPIFQYDHPTSSGAGAGGAVYRGADIPALWGKLILADFTGSTVRITAI